MPLPQDPHSFLLMAIFIEGESVTPMLLARRFILNPVLVIVALVFWYWMWASPARFSPRRGSPPSRSSAIASAR
jgi:hypothetical protein